MHSNIDQLFSNIDQVIGVNNLTGNVIPEKFWDKAYAIERQCGIILSEIAEGRQNINNQLSHLRRMAFIDDIWDMWYTITGMFARADINPVVTMMYAKQYPNDYPTELVNFANSLSTMERHISEIKQAASQLLDSEDPDHPGVIQPGDIRQLNRFAETKLASAMVELFAMVEFMGLDVHQNQQAVIDSNMSKFDTTLEDAQKSMQKYIDKGIEVEIVESVYAETTYFIIKSTKDQIVDFKDYPKGKYLKADKFFEPVYN